MAPAAPATGQTIESIVSALEQAGVEVRDVRGDTTARVNGLAPIATAEPGQITHLSSRAYRRYLPATRAAVVLLRAADAADCPTAAVVVANPYLAFAVVSQLFAGRSPPPLGVHPAAHVHAAAAVHDTASVGPGAMVAAGADVGAGAVLGANVLVGEGSSIGADTVVHGNATLYANVRVGRRCVIHSGAIIGADGFGFTPDDAGRLQAIAQLGGVNIGDDVVVGAGTAIDCGTLADTVVGDGVKIDNQVQIGHNCDIGAHTVLCGQVGLAGSTRVGRHCMLGGGVGVAGDQPITICDGARIGAMTSVTRSIDKPGVYLGAVLHNEATRWKRTVLRLGQLDELAKRVARLEAGSVTGIGGAETKAEDSP